MARKDDEDDQIVPEEVPHLAKGDILDDFSVGMGDSSTAQGAVPIQAPPEKDYMQQMYEAHGFPNERIEAPQLATGADPSGSGPKPAVVTQPNALATKASNPTALPGMPPDVTPDELERYLGRAKDSFGKYGADQQFALSQQMLNARRSPGASLANAGAGFADGIMQGVAEAGNPGFQKNMQDRQQGIYNDTLGAMKGAHDTALQDVHASIDMDSKDPHSPLSQSSQKAYAATLVAAGIPKDQVPNMSAELIGDVAGKRISLADALARLQLESTYKLGELDLQKRTLDANMADKKSQRTAEAAKALEGRGVWRRVTDKVTGNPATKALEQELTPGTTFATEAEAAAAGLPDGTPITVGGKSGTWRHK